MLLSQCENVSTLQTNKPGPRSVLIGDMYRRRSEASRSVHAIDTISGVFETLVLLPTARSIGTA